MYWNSFLCSFQQFKALLIKITAFSYMTPLWLVIFPNLSKGVVLITFIAVEYNATNFPAIYLSATALESEAGSSSEV
jgi:hypothetical protein